MKYELHTLQNGLEVLFVDVGAFPTMTTQLLVSAGSRYERKDNNGIAHFFEHIPFKGTKKYPTAFDISSNIEGRGGLFNAFTSKDHTAYWIKTLADHFETSVDLLSDMILNPLLDPEEIEREKGVIVEEINMYEDTPARRVNEVLENIMYPDNPLGFDILGTKDTVTSFNKKTFSEYMDTFYYPNNAVFVVAGKLNNNGNEKLEVKKYLEIVEEKFGSWKPGQKPAFTPVVENQNEPKVHIRYKKTEQAHFAIGFRAFSFNDPRRETLSILSTILGGGSSSRLFIEVRERRGLCYYIGAGRDFYRDTGNFVIQAGVTNQVDKVKQAIAVTLKECQKIAQGDLKPDELTRAKEMLKGRILLSFEDSANVANFFAYNKLIEGKIKDPAALLKKVDAVTGADVIDLAKTIFVSGHLNFAIIGPFEKDAITTADVTL